MTGVALGLVLLSALLHASWNTATKGSDEPTAFLLGMECVALILFVPLLFLFEWSQVPVATWCALAGSVVTHAFYADWLTRGYQHGELSLVYPIARSTPALVPLVAIPLLGESVSAVGAAGIGLVLVGMWAVQTDGRLNLEDLRSPAARFAYLTLMSTVIYSIIDKQGMAALSDAEWSGPAPRALVYMALLELAYVPIFAALAVRRIEFSAVRALLRRRGWVVVGGAVAGIASYGLILEAYRTAPVSYVVAIRQASVLFALALSVVLLRERPGRVRMLGAFANVAGVGLIALFG